MVINGHRFATRFLAALWILCALLARPILAQTAPQGEHQVAAKNVLLLYSYGHGSKGIEVFDNGLLETLGANGVSTTQLYFEYLDLERNLADPQYRSNLQALINRKYRDRTIDLIVTVQQPALNYLLNEGKSLAVGAPAITLQAPMPSVSEVGNRRILSMLASFDIKGTIEKALELFPETRRVVFVSGSSDADKSLSKQAASIAQSWQGRLEFEYTTEMPLEVMLKRVANLPALSIVIFTQYNRDTSGNVTVAYEVERAIIKTANAPVFGLYDFNLVNGGIGGSVVGVKELGERTGRLVLDILTGRQQPTQPVSSIRVNPISMFDWGQIKRWGGDPSRLSGNPMFINRVPTFWDQYKLYLLGISVFILGQFFLIIALVTNRRSRRRAEITLRESQDRYQKLVENTPDLITWVDSEGRFTFVNGSAETVFGLSPQECIGRLAFDFIHPQDREATQIAFNAWHDIPGPTLSYENRQVSVTGEIRHMQWNIVPDRNEAGEITGFESIGRDVTQARKVEAALRQSDDRYREIFNAVDDAIFMLDPKAGVIVDVNRHMCELYGYSYEQALTCGPGELSANTPPYTAAEAFEKFKLTLTEGPQTFDWLARKSDGQQFWASVSLRFARIGTDDRILAVVRDISERKQAESQILALAFSDPLTGLPNRRLLMDRLEQALTTAHRHSRHVALLFIDLDNFKTINDTLGHHNGDSLLKQVAQRLLTSVREGDTVARLGGDEFVVLLEDLSNNLQEAATQAQVVTAKILNTLGQSYKIEDHGYHSTASIGIAMFGGSGRENIEEPLKRAELAMYQAKAAGRNTLRYFEPEMATVVTTRATLEAELREAVTNSQFVLYYQPQFGHDVLLTGVEALVRWQHPQRGLVSPAEFIPIAEMSGLILPLGRWVLEAACKQLSAWAAQPGSAHLTIAVNVSARQFRQPDFVQEVLSILNANGAKPERLKIELTESVLVDNMEDIVVKMNALKAKGVGFAIDDFGTGYSSLSYLKRLPLDQLKIDQGFIRDILIDPDDAAIAKMVVALADSLGLSVIAEGVESEEQRDFLANLGCHNYQGYLFSKPLPIREFEEFAAEALRVLKS